MIFINGKFSANSEKIWEAQNGATRRTLVLINKTGQEIDGFIDGSVGTLDKGNHSFIFINNKKSDDNRIFGIFLNNSYGYKKIKGEEIYTASSVGGYGNSESKFGIYTVGTVLEINTYKNRQSSSFVELTDKGWVTLMQEQIFENEVKYL